MMGMQPDWNPNPFVEIGGPGDTTYLDEFAEGHIHFRSLRGIQPIQGHSHANQMLVGAINEEHDAVFIGIPEPGAQRGEDLVTLLFVDQTFAIRRQPYAGSIKVKRTKQKHRVGVRDESRGPASFFIPRKTPIIEDRNFSWLTTNELRSGRADVLLSYDPWIDQQPLLGFPAEFGVGKNRLKARTDQSPSPFVSNRDVVNFRKRSEPLRLFGRAK